MVSCLSAYGRWSHGGQIEWESLGNDSFKITVSVYRDCNGPYAYNYPSRLSSTCGTKRLAMKSVSVEDITPVCSQQCSRCGSGSCTFKFGIQKYVFTGVVSLADWKKNSCCLVTISWGNCCRTASITTGGARNNFYMKADMNVCASSVAELNYQKDPLSLACMGREFYTNHFEISTNNAQDSVVYGLREPLQSAASRMIWSSPYSYDKPIYFLGFPKTNRDAPSGFHVDALTGEMNFTPMKEEVTMLSMQARVWRKGVYLGSVMREHVFMTIKCPNNILPVLSGIDCSNPWPANYEITVCPGDSLGFKVCTSDRDKSDTVTLSWKHSIPGLSVVVENPGDREERASISWKPDSTHVRTAPYVLRIVARDNACAINGLVSKLYKIYVRPKTNVSFSLSNKKCGTYELIAKGKDSALFTKTTWNFKGHGNFKSKDTALSDTLLTSFDSPGFYPYTFESEHLHYCNFTLSDSVFAANDFLQMTMGADSIRACEDSPIQLKASAQKAIGTTQFIWSTGDTTHGLTSKINTQFTDKQQWITVTAKDSACSDSDTLLLISNINPTVTFSDTNASCKGDTVFLNPIFSNPAIEITSLTHYEWLDSNHTLLSDTGLSFVALAPGIYQLRLTDTAGCTGLSQVLVQHVIPEFNMIPDTTNCIDEKVTLNLSSNESGTFTWYIGGDSLNNARLVFNNTSKAEFVTVASENITVLFEASRLGTTCVTQKTSHLKVHPTPQFRIEHSDSICQRDSVQLVSKTVATWQMPHRRVTGDTVWYYAQNMNGNDSSFTTYLNAIDSNGCTNDTILNFYHLRSPKSGFIAPDSVVKNTDFIVDNETVTAHQNIYRWTVGNPAFLSYTTYEPIIRIDSLGLFDIQLVVLDNVSRCTDVTSRQIQVVRNKSVETHFNAQFEVYPNPSSGVFYVSSPNVRNYCYQMYTLSGHVLASGNAQQSALIDLSEHMRGMYILRIVSPSGNYTVLLEKM